MFAILRRNVIQRRITAIGAKSVNVKKYDRQARAAFSMRKGQRDRQSLIESPYRTQ